MSRKRIEKREIRVFVSSTFQDLHEERDYIIRRTFPRLQDYCRKRGIQFTGVDLRWGITASQSESGKTIKLCLDEIKRCQPYFINIIGQRYGWIPTREEFEKDNQLMMDYEDLINVSMENEVSITEMEIIEGVFNNPEEVNAFFFLGEEETYKNKNLLLGIEQESDEAFAKLADLKKRIKESGYPTYENFTSPQMLGEIVYESLKDAIDRQFPVETNLSPLEAIESVHQMFAMSRKDFYYQRDGIQSVVSEQLRAHEKAIALIGESGTGKSAFMANFLDDFEEDHNYHIIEHYVGAESSREVDIIRHILLSLHAYDQVALNEQGRFNKMLTVLKSVLETVDKKILIAIDAYNQVNDSYSGFKWLSEIVSDKVTVLVTSIPSDDVKELSKDTWSKIYLKPFNKEEIEAIISSVLTLHGKSIDETLLKTIVDNEKHKEKFGIIKEVLLSDYGEYAGHLGNALYLRVFLNELIMASKHETLEKQMLHYLDAINVQVLLGLVLDRLEDEFGEDVVRFLMGHLSVSREGFSEQELRVLAKNQGIAYLNLVECMDNLSTHLMKRGDRLDFFHQHIAAVVESRYLSDEQYEKEVRFNIIETFKDSSEGNGHLEVIYQLYNLEEAETIYDFLSDLSTFKVFYEKNYFELNLYLRFCEAAGFSVIDALYLKSSGDFEASMMLANMMFQVRRYETTKDILLRHLLEFDGFEEKSRIMRLLTAVHLKLKDYDEAIMVAGEHLDEIGHTSNILEVAKAKYNLGYCYFESKDFMKASDYFSQAMNASDEKLKVRAEVMNTLSQLYKKIKLSVVEDDPLLQDILVRPTLVLGDLSKELGMLHMALADLLAYHGEEKGASKHRLKALGIYEKLYGDVHVVLSDVYLKLNQPFDAMVTSTVTLGIEHGESVEALDAYRKSLSSVDEKDSLLREFLKQVKKMKMLPDYDTLDSQMKLKRKYRKINKKSKRTLLFTFLSIHAFLFVMMLALQPMFLGFFEIVMIIFLCSIGAFTGYGKVRTAPFEVALFSLAPLSFEFASGYSNALANHYAVFWLGRNSIRGYVVFSKYLGQQPYSEIHELITKGHSFLSLGIRRFAFFIVAYVIGRVVGEMMRQNEALKAMLLLEGGRHD